MLLKKLKLRKAQDVRCECCKMKLNSSSTSAKQGLVTRPVTGSTGCTFHTSEWILFSHERFRNSSTVEALIKRSATIFFTPPYKRVWRDITWERRSSTKTSISVPEREKKTLRCYSVILRLCPDGTTCHLTHSLVQST